MGNNPIETLTCAIVWMPLFLVYIAVLVFVRLAYGRKSAGRMMGVDLTSEGQSDVE